MEMVSRDRGSHDCDVILVPTLCVATTVTVYYVADHDILVVCPYERFRLLVLQDSGAHLGGGASTDGKSRHLELKFSKNADPWACSHRRRARRCSCHVKLNGKVSTLL